MSKPKVILSAGNIAHYHNTAIALQRADYLKLYLCVFSGSNDLGIFEPFLSKNIKKRLGGKINSELNLNLVHTIKWPYLVTQIFRRSGLIGAGQANKWFTFFYDQAAISWVKDCDIFHFVNSAGIKTARKVKSNGGRLICDVREPHPDCQEKIVHDEYDKIGLTYKSPPITYRNRLVEELNLADEIISPSEYVKHSFLQAGYKTEHIHVVPYGVDLNRFEQNKNTCKYGYMKKKVFRILFVGSLIPRKGLHYLVQAFERMNLPDSELIIIGTGEPEYRLYLEKTVKRSNVKFYGDIPQTELCYWYQNSDVFMLPSLSDAFALVVTEAMASGLPVIVTENTGAKDLIEDGREGFVIPIRCVDRIEEKVLWCYDHPEEREEMGDKAAIKVQEFSWTNYQEKLNSAYAQILKNNILE